MIPLKQTDKTQRSVASEVFYAGNKTGRTYAPGCDRSVSSAVIPAESVLPEVSLSGR